MPCAESSSFNGVAAASGPYQSIEECLEACREGACCNGFVCEVKPQCQCDTANGFIFEGVGTTCNEPSPCRPPCLAGCLDLPTQVVFTVTGPEESGDPWGNDPSSPESWELEPGEFNSPRITKTRSITFSAVDEVIVVDLLPFKFNSFDGNSGSIAGEFLRVQRFSSGSFCRIRARAIQGVSTATRDRLIDESGTTFGEFPAGIDYQETRSALMDISFYPDGPISVSSFEGWRGMGYRAVGANQISASGSPTWSRETTYSLQSPPASTCRDYEASLVKQQLDPTGVGGDSGPVFADGSGFCLIPDVGSWIGAGSPSSEFQVGSAFTSVPPNVGDGYKFMVGFVIGCGTPFYGPQVRVGSHLTITAEIQ